MRRIFRKTGESFMVFELIGGTYSNIISTESCVVGNS